MIELGLNQNLTDDLLQINSDEEQLNDEKNPQRASRIKSDYLKPGSLFKAKEHQLATFIYDLDDVKQENLQFCDCCLNPIPEDPNKYKFPLLFDKRERRDNTLLESEVRVNAVCIA